jgi:hypothetical protein
MGIAILGVICVAAVAFMARFFVALCRDQSGRKCYVVPVGTPGWEGPLSLATENVPASRSRVA